MNESTSFCGFEGCARPHRSKGLCSRHWAQQHAGLPLVPIVNKRRGVCNLEGCEQRHYAIGYCHAHYARNARTGEPGASEINSPDPGECSFEGCDKAKNCKGLCVGHYSQMRKGRELTTLTRQFKQPVRDLMLKAKYGITREQFDEALERQGGGCAICGGTNPSGRDFHVDHDHSCCPGGKSCGECFRGALCSRCNTGLGMFKDSTQLLMLAIKYVGG